MVVATALHGGLKRLCLWHVGRCRGAQRWSEPGWFRAACRLEAALRGRAGRVAFDALLLLAVVGAGWAWIGTGRATPGTVPATGPGREAAVPAWAEVVGAPIAGPDGGRYGPIPEDPAAAPTLREIRLPEFPGAYAVWGATGRDRRGHVWVGVSAHQVARPSAHLIEYDPDADRVIDRGDVVGQLERLGLARSGEGQMKIHSKIVPGPDGFLYFASMDEQGEATDGSRLPTWGSHLWRVRPDGGDWEHLLAVPEGLIAVAGGGPFIYALGYFDHALFQYDCRTGAVRSVRVGAEGGHISRNFLADDRGHAYVPRLRRYTIGGESAMRTTLVEYDETLREQNETPIRHYSENTDDSSHGIVGLVHLADRSMVFATDRGALYRIVPLEKRPALVLPLGFIHPEGESYTASLFTYSGDRYVMGASRRDGADEWCVFDLDDGSSTASPLVPPGGSWPGGEAPLLYGSMTRDDDGRFYLAGTGNDRALFFQVIPPSLAPPDDRLAGAADPPRGGPPSP